MSTDFMRDPVISGFRLVRSIRPVSEKDVLSQLDELQERHTQWLPQRNGLKKGDRVHLKGVFSVVGTGTWESYEDHLILGGDRMDPATFRLVAGMHVGQAIDVPDLVMEHNATRTLHVRFTLVEATRGTKPALTNEFVRRTTGYPTLAKLRAGIWRNLQKQSREEARQQLLQQLRVHLAFVNRDFPVEEAEYDKLVAANTPKDANPSQVQIVQRAARDHCIIGAVLDRVAMDQELRTTDEEFTAYAADVAKQNKTTTDLILVRIEKQGNKDSIYRGLLHQKTLDYVLSQNSPVTEPYT